MIAFAMCCALAGLSLDDWDSVYDGVTPSWNRLTLTGEAPVDVETRVPLRGEAQYGWFYFGELGSTRVMVLVDRAIDRSDLYVDLNRNLSLEPDEKLTPAGGIWELDLPVLAPGDGPPRTVRFRQSPVTGSFSWANMIALDGVVSMAGREVAARRIDSDANGLYTDVRDQVWLDLNTDGEFDPFRERFPCMPILHIEGERWLLRSDRRGMQLTFEEGAGSGKLRLELAGGQPISSMHVLMVSKEGGAFGVQAHDRAVEIPAGEWRVGMVSVNLADGGGGQDWGFIFSDVGRGSARWITIEEDQETSFDPIGKVNLELGLDDGINAVHPGQQLRGSPRLMTEDGLLINVAFRGASSSMGNQTWAIVKLCSDAGALLDSDRTGFA